MIGVGVTVGVIAFVAFMGASHNVQTFTERMKLEKGEISVFQYCSHLGKAAVDDENCTEFNMLYGPND